MKFYLNSGQGIKEPVDFFGNIIKEGDILSDNTIGTEYEDEGDREKPFFIVLKKVTEKKTFLFGLGLNRPKRDYSGRFYAHDFTFKKAVRLGSLKDMPEVLQPISDKEITRLRFKNSNIIPAIYHFSE